MRASAILAAEARRSWRAAPIVAVYTLAVYGALPALLWTLGARFDAALRLRALGGVAAAAWPAIGAALGGAGAAIALASIARLRWPGGGWPISHLPPTRFVAVGPYTLVRHPIYVGYTLALAGAGLAGRSVGRGVLAPLVLTLAWVVYALAFEEPRLRARFGQTYDAYVATTPLVPVPFRRALVAAARRLWRAVRPAVERLANRTVLFRSGGTLWVTYGALVATGGVVAAAVNAPLLAGWGASAGTIAAFQLGLAAAMLAGGRLVWLAYQWRRLLREPSIVWRRVGFVSFGGYLGLVAFTLGFARAAGFELLGFLDRSLPAALLISAFGRLGCLSYGCCYGRPCAGGLRWTAPAAKVNRERGEAGRAPRVPTPLLSALVALAAAGLGLAVLLCGAAPGAATASATLVYAGLRVGVEHWRDEARFTAWRLTIGQLLSLVIAAASLALWLALPAGGAGAAAGAPLRVDWRVLGAVAPALPGVFALAFAVCGYHRKEVGRW